MRKIILFLAALLLSSCTTLMAPFIGVNIDWADEGSGLVEASYDLGKGADIFMDHLWTTPNIRSRNLVFENRKAAISFAGEELVFQFNQEQNLMLTGSDGEVLVSSISNSKDRYYPNINALKVKYVTVTKWVPVTKTEHQTVAVQKTRQVPVTTFGANGVATTSWRTEFYTDWETRVTTVTSHEWQTEQQPMVDIGKADFYAFAFKGMQLLVYKTETEQGTKYFFQNASYYYITSEEKKLFGNKISKILFIDADSDGVFLEGEDKVFFNTWHPYKKGSKYVPLEGIQENKWYNLGYIESDKMIGFWEEEDALQIKNKNMPYFDQKEEGTLIIQNSDFKNTELYINGKKYSQMTLFRKPISSYDCRYGYYKLRILNPGYEDYIYEFEVNQDNPMVEIAYQLPEKAATLKINNIFAKNYSVTVNSKGKSERNYSTPKSVSLLMGSNEVTIYIDGFTLTKVFNVEENTDIDWDFEEEIQKEST